jgi:hypothetical protein
VPHRKLADLIPGDFGRGAIMQLKRALIRRLRKLRCGARGTPVADAPGSPAGRTAG